MCVFLALSSRNLIFSCYCEEFLLPSSCLAVILQRCRDQLLLQCYLDEFAGLYQKSSALSSKYSTMMHSPNQIQSTPFSLESPKDRIIYNSAHFKQNDSASLIPHRIGENVPRKDKIDFLVKTLMDLNDSKEVVYSTLDAWVAWERNFPTGALKNIVLILEKDQQWHRMIIVKLFKCLKDFDRKFPEKSIVRKVADAYEILGKPEEKERILEKYKDLFTETTNEKANKHG